jgi:ankyrin repeat protein
MYASDNGHTATVEVLVGAGADTEAKDNVRNTIRETNTHSG